MGRLAKTKTRVLANLEEIQALEQEIRCASEYALSEVQGLAQQGDALGLLEAVKFGKIGRVAGVAAKHRYVFFHCPGNHDCETVGEVKVVPLGLR